MAVAATETKAKKTRGKGPIQITYVDGAGKAGFKRVPDVVTAIRVVQADGKAKDYDPRKLSAATQARQNAYAGATRIKLFTMHNVEDPTKALEAIDQLWADFSADKLYARAEGTGERRGKVFSPDIYIEATKLAHTEMFEVKATYPKDAIKNGKPIGGQIIATKPPTQKQLDDKRAYLVSLPTKERTAELARMNANPFYAKHLLALKSKKIDTSEADSLF